MMLLTPSSTASSQFLRRRRWAQRGIKYKKKETEGRIIPVLSYNIQIKLPLLLCERRLSLLLLFSFFFFFFLFSPKTPVTTHNAAHTDSTFTFSLPADPSSAALPWRVIVRLSRAVNTASLYIFPFEVFKIKQTRLRVSM